MERREVFVSYAREDGEEAAKELAIRLESEGLAVWLDRLDMRGGQDWWRQIADAIDRSGFLVLLMTPGAIASPTTGREWRYARQQGVCVFPVAASPDLDFAAMPKWMAAKHFYSFPQEWETFLAYLKSPCVAERVPFMAPSLPRGYVERRAELDALKDLVLDVGRRDPVAITTTLQGSGGFGKTTLAAALCHDEDVQAAFDDGLLWATLGRETDRVRRELEKLFRALTGQAMHAIDEDDAARQVAERLSDRRALLVIDDVWSTADLRWFLEGGTACARVVTTRQFDVAREAAPETGARVRVDEMTEGEAIELLAAGLELDGGGAAAVRDLVHRLGEWPLLIKLVKGALHERLDRGDRIDRALRYVNQALDRHGLVAFDAGDSTQRNDAANSSVAASLQLLDAEDAARWKELAIFPEDAPVPLRTLANLWGLDDFATEELAARLDDLALVRLDLAADTIHVHDVLLAVARQEAGDLQRLHRRLTDAWGDPRALPDEDAYAWTWIGFHLVGAGRHDLLRELLLDPAWLVAKLERTGSHSLVVECDRLADAAELRLLSGAIRLSGHVLDADPSQLTSQLCGRLSPASGDAIAGLLDAAIAAADESWLRPTTRSLLSPGGPLLGTLVGHSAAVSAVGLTPDGSKVVTGSWDGTVRIWDAETASEVRTLRFDGSEVSAVAVFPDGRRVASAYRDGTLKSWDLATGEALFTIRAHTTWVFGLAITPDGAQIISTSADGTAKVWDAQTGELRHPLEGHARALFGVAVTSSHVAATSGDGTVKVWDLESGRELATLVGDTRWLSGVAVSPDGTRLAATARHAAVKVWDLRHAEELRTLRGHHGWVFAVTFTPDGRHVVSGSRDMTVKIWDLHTGAALRTLEGHTKPVSSVAVTPDGSRVVSGSRDRTVRIWSLDPETEQPDVDRHRLEVTALVALRDRDRILSASADGTVGIWDLETGTRLDTIEHGMQVLAAAVTPDARLVVTGSRNGEVRVLDLERRGEVHRLAAHSAEVTCVVLSPDGRQAVSASGDGTLKVWDLQSGAELRTLAGHHRAVSAAAITPDARHVISASEDGTIKLWDLTHGSELRTWRGHEAPVHRIAVTPDGWGVVSASADHTVKLWEPFGHQPVRIFAGHGDGVSDVAVTPDGLRLVSSSLDRTLKVWAITSATPMATFTADEPITACAVATREWMCAGGASGRIHILNLVEPEHPTP